MKEDLMGVTLTPAYGRNYKSAEEVIEEFSSGKDFVIRHPMHRWNNKYTSIRDMKLGEFIYLRYNKNKDITVFTKTEDNDDYEY